MEEELLRLGWAMWMMEEWWSFIFLMHSSYSRSHTLMLDSEIVTRMSLLGMV